MSSGVTLHCRGRGAWAHNEEYASLQGLLLNPCQHVLQRLSIL